MLIVTNGRIKSKPGQSRTLAFGNFSEAWDHFFLLANKTTQQLGFVF